ncbi:MAG: hypothetical protein HY074_07920, partial [Deltaproteobacteria bacterium]|nr:hypothetical protein [Deltaproteobacteria bacterium]
MNTRLVIGIICYTMLSPSIAWALAKKLIRPPAVPASIAQADLVEGCPIDRAPHSLRSAIDELVSKTRESVSKLDDAQTAALCRTQAEELESAGADEGISDDDSSDQDEQSHINSAVRKATALRGVTAKATALLSNGCIGKTADRASIVRLVGQVITAGVSVLGPVPGLIASLGGEI